jgi:nucleoid-associated protein EbfC
MIDPSKMMDMLKQAQEMQEQMQRELAAQKVEGSAGGGMVKVSVNGLLQVQRVSIDPRAVDKADVGTLEDLVRAALQQALQKVEELRVEQASKMAGGMGMPPGLLS